MAAPPTAKLGIAPGAETYPFTPEERFILEHLDEPDLEAQLLAHFPSLRRHLLPAPFCGTTNGYNYHKCRCTLCKQAMSLHQKKRLPRKRS